MSSFGVTRFSSPGRRLRHYATNTRASVSIQTRVDIDTAAYKGAVWNQHLLDDSSSLDQITENTYDITIMATYTTRN